MITAAKVNKWADTATEIEDSIWREKGQPSKAASRLWGLIHEMKAEAAAEQTQEPKRPAPTVWEALQLLWEKAWPAGYLGEVDMERLQQCHTVLAEALREREGVNAKQ